MKSFFAWFVERPLIVNLIMAMVLLMGVYTLQKAPIKAVPEINNGRFAITTLRPGASAEKMELSVTVPLEKELESVDGIKKLRSNSAEGMSLIQIDASASANRDDLDRMTQDLQRAIDRATSKLPGDLLEKPLLIEAKSIDYPLKIIMLYGEASEATLRRLTRSLQDQIRTLPGVRGVDRLGYRDREVHIQLDPAKLDRLGVSYAEIQRAINGRNVTETGGSLASFVGEQNVVAVAEFEHPKDVAEVIVRTDGAGNYLTVGDLATITNGFAEPSVSYHKNGRRGVVLTVRGSEKASDLRTGREIEKKVKEFARDLPPTITAEVVEDGTRIVQQVLSMLLNNAMIGAVLIIIALLLFFPWRATLWVVAGMPVAIMGALALMPIFGVTNNTVSFVAIILMLGLMVDDAIVTSETIYAKFEEGLPPTQAGIEGVASIARPVTTGALTTVLAMMPLLMMGGQDAKFMWVIPATVILVVIASLVECFLLLPSHIAHSLKSAKAVNAKASWFRHVQRFYMQTLDPILDRPKTALLLGSAVAVLATVIVANFLKFESYPESEATNLILTAKLSTGTPLEETAALLSDLEAAVLEELDDDIVTGYFSVAGETSHPTSNDMIEVKASNIGKVEIALVEGRFRDETAVEVAERLQKLSALFPQLLHFEVVINNEQPSVGFPVETRVTVHDDDVRGRVAGRILNWLQAHPAVTISSTSYTPGKSVIKLDLDYQRLANAGVDVADVTQALRLAYDGIIVEELQTVEERVRYRLQLADKYRRDIGALRSLNVLNDRGEQVPLRNLANFRIERGQSVIAHFGGRRTETITAEIDRGKTTVADINKELDAWLAEQQFEVEHPGLQITQGGEIEAQAETAGNLGTGLLIVLLSVFFLMVLLFNSLGQPLIIMAVIPLAFIAVLLVFIVHGLILGVSAIVGFLGLAGVLVNSSLVLVDQVNRLHRERDAESRLTKLDIREGARRRLRPILITALTTGAGLGPAAYGIAGAHPSQTPMIMVMFWGSLVGAIITLYTVPLLMALASDKSSPVAEI